MATGHIDQENKGGEDQTLSGTTPLNEIQIQALPPIPRNDLPIMEGIVTAVGLSLLLAGFLMNDPKMLMRKLGIALLALALIVLIVEMIVERAKAAAYFRTVRPMIDELEKLRSTISEYLVEMDKRTSRYFHCVTNTKVTTYFMLRQLEGSIEELMADVGGKARGSSPSGYRYVRERLRGSLEFRDGFEFSKGKLFHVPIGKLPAMVHQLMTELEAGVKMLEDENRSLSDQAKHPSYGPPERETEPKAKKKTFDKDF